MTVLPLPIWPHARLETSLSLLKEAKALIDTEVLVDPRPAHPGSPGPIFAWGEVAPWASEQILIRAENVDRLESVRGALEAWLNPATKPTVTHASWLGAVMGCGVKLIREEVVGKAPEPLIRAV